MISHNDPTPARKHRLFPDVIYLPPMPGQQAEPFAQIVCPSCNRRTYHEAEFVDERVRNRDQFSCSCAARIHFRDQNDLPVARNYEPEVDSEPTTELPCGYPDIARSIDELREWGLLFKTVYADPPWRYDNVASNGAAEHHYRTMSLDDICALPVESICDSSAHLHLWVPVPLLPEGLRVLNAWGFRYVSALIWIKPGRLGLGNYYRVNTETLLLGTRGKAMRFRRRDVRNYLTANPSDHSTKPDKVREIIEQVSPPPRVELFSRRTARTWLVMGENVQRYLF